MFFRGRRPLVATLGVALLAVPLLNASAQTAGAPPPSSSSQAGAQAEPWMLRSASGDYQVGPTGSIQAGALAMLANRSPVQSGLLLRRARLGANGRVARYVAFNTGWNFVNGAPTLVNAYATVRLSPLFGVRVGKDKVPVGYEYLISGNYILFPERALPTLLAAGRELGIRALGELPVRGTTYDVGVFSGKELAGRVVTRPLRSTRGWIAGLGGQLGISTEGHARTLTSLNTSVDQTYFWYAPDVTPRGRLTRVVPAAFYYWKSVGAFGEYIRATESISRRGVATDVASQAWQVAASVVLTGEAATEAGLRPLHRLNPRAGHWGAVQVALRYGRLTVGREAFASAAAAADASDGAREFTAGVSWYPEAHLRYELAFERTTFGAGPSGTRPPENSLQMRAQAAF